jgi:hypothetical protein
MSLQEVANEVVAVYQKSIRLNVLQDSREQNRNEGKPISTLAIYNLSHLKALLLFRRTGAGGAFRNYPELRNILLPSLRGLSHRVFPQGSKLSRRRSSAYQLKGGQTQQVALCNHDCG